MWAIVTPRGRIIYKRKDRDIVERSFIAGIYFDQYPKGTTVQKIGA